MCPRSRGSLRTTSTVILDPLAEVVYGSGSSGIADKIGVLTVDVLIAIAWVASTVRQLGDLATAAGQHDRSGGSSVRRTDPIISPRSL